MLLLNLFFFFLSLLMNLAEYSFHTFNFMVSLQKIPKTEYVTQFEMPCC